MSIWAVLAAPLFMSNKLSDIRPEFKEILQNNEIIKINQDALGIQGKRVFMVGLVNNYQLTFLVDYFQYLRTYPIFDPTWSHP